MSPDRQEHAVTHYVRDDPSLNLDLPHALLRSTSTQTSLANIDYLHCIWSLGDFVALQDFRTDILLGRSPRLSTYSRLSRF